jgi:hypothetical protein
MKTSKDIRNSMLALEKLMAGKDLTDQTEQDNLLQDFGKITSAKEQQILSMALKLKGRIK